MVFEVYEDSMSPFWTLKFPLFQPVLNMANVRYCLQTAKINVTQASMKPWKLLLSSELGAVTFLKSVILQKILVYMTLWLKLSIVRDLQDVFEVGKDLKTMKKFEFFQKILFSGFLVHFRPKCFF